MPDHLQECLWCSKTYKTFISMGAHILKEHPLVEIGGRRLSGLQLVGRRSNHTKLRVSCWCGQLCNMVGYPPFWFHLKQKGGIVVHAAEIALIG